MPLSPLSEEQARALYASEYVGAGKSLHTIELEQGLGFGQFRHAVKRYGLPVRGNRGSGRPRGKSPLHPELTPAFARQLLEVEHLQHRRTLVSIDLEHGWRDGTLGRWAKKLGVSVRTGLELRGEASVPVRMRLPASLCERLDAARGQLRRGAYIRRLVEEALAGERET